MSTTLSDFWRLVWEQKVGVVVMLCEVGDDCCQYFPLTELKSVMEHGELQVETVRQRLTEGT